MNRFNTDLILISAFIVNIFVLIYNIYFENWYLLPITIIALGFCIYSYNLRQESKKIERELKDLEELEK